MFSGLGIVVEVWQIGFLRSFRCFVGFFWVFKRTVVKILHSGVSMSNV